MREGSTKQFPTTGPLQDLQPEAKSLFQRILPISHYGSIFYSDTLLSPSHKLLRMKILRTGPKKNVEIVPVTIPRPAPPTTAKPGCIRESPICRPTGTWLPLRLTTPDLPFICAQGRLGLDYVAAPRLGRGGLGCPISIGRRKNSRSRWGRLRARGALLGESCTKLVQFGDECCATCPVGPRRARG
jgi:hypothetical protein